jgi:hypothetical protein
MCYPLLIFAAVSAVSAYSASETRKDAARYQSQVAANNAKVADWQAQDAKERGDQAAAAVRRRASALQGSQIANLAARGLDISEGSANAILTDTDFFGEYDQNITRANAAREAYGFKVRAGNFRGDAAASAAMADAENPLLSGVVAGAGSYFSGSAQGMSGGFNSLLSDGKQVASRWYGSGGT